MSSKASFAHHPLHPMLITLPLGLWFTSIICDAIYTFNNQPIAREMAHYLLLAGCMGASTLVDPERLLQRHVLAPLDYPPHPPPTKPTT